MKITKKQWVVGGLAVLVLAGGSAGIVANNQAQMQAERTAQAAKVAHDNLIKSAKELTKKAETFKVEADVQTAQDAIKKLDEKDKTALIARIEKVQKNWDLVNATNKAVLSAEKSKTEASVKIAQMDIDKLKEEMTTSKKTALQKRLDKVKATLKDQKEEAQAEAKKKAQEKGAADAKASQEAVIAQSETQASASNNAGVQNPTFASSADTGTYIQESQAPSYNAPASPSYAAPAGGGGAQAPSTPSSNTGNLAYNSGAGANANPNVSLEDGNKAIEDANNHLNGAPSANGGR